MNELKYIIFQPTGMAERAILFNGLLVHSIIAEGIVKQGFKVISAGFCMIAKGDAVWPFECYGESESLKIKSRPEDSEVVSLTVGRAHYF